jgi:polysaccharide pyruvyl transferase WcaK-like protein
MGDTATKSGRLHICLTGGWFSGDNIGDHAILCGILDSFQRLGDVRFSVLTAGVDKMRERYGLPAFAPKKTPIGLLRNLLGADALVFTGGTPFYEARTHMTYYAALAGLARARGIPVVAFGISLRSFQGWYGDMALRRIVSWSDLLGGREENTLDRFRQLAPDPDKVAYVPDTAMSMRPSDPSRAAELLIADGADPQARNLAICMRDFRAERSFQIHHYSRAFDDGTLARYHETAIRLAEHAIRAHDCNVVFCPMNTRPPDDDRRVMNEVRESISDPELKKRTTVITQQHGPRDMKAILGSMHAVVGVRFHSLVLAMSMSVPALAICYALKNQAIMQQMHQSRFSLDLVEADPDRAIERLDELMEARSQLVRTLCDRNAQIERVYGRQLDRLGELIRNRCR